MNEIWIAKIPTPIFNTAEIPFNQLPLKKDAQGRLTEIETIAFPGTRFKSVRPVNDIVLQVETAEYPSSKPLYVDRRFLQKAPEDLQERIKQLPSVQEILQWMEHRVGLRYFWGGNWDVGISEILELYPHLQQANEEDQDDALCRGLDCSGLLYQATQGITPRNTSELIHFGKELSLHHLSLGQIQAELKPLDLLVWKGHVILVRSPTTLIESRIHQGVVVSDFETRYAEVIAMLKEQNKQLYFRRWHPSS
ncbi:MAG: hypothetical protein JSS10_04215 [Verrucomicrobia bacterium]|nr:hypothetical protein [Verrucomicrobiota bacterium]